MSNETTTESGLIASAVPVLGETRMGSVTDYSTECPAIVTMERNKFSKWLVRRADGDDFAMMPAPEDELTTRILELVPNLKLPTKQEIYGSVTFTIEPWVYHYAFDKSAKRSKDMAVKIVVNIATLWVFMYTT
ncbi:hypothetical protein BDB00DRAFT_871740 [Zychaea mexicana]|uniref:uncharacterized protein n=1 Tax=Zychaea mexicana TaxID=64656 RepID=UPI0022FED233|nr:uncharacterized protein BDB00DRAFT_871740 [Zychaea mexicana]KAI9493978.1 hypothetical protein BDB00DRAFT_871740 [Zychaea mexicana]